MSLCIILKSMNKKSHETTGILTPSKFMRKQMLRSPKLRLTILCCLPILVSCLVMAIAIPKYSTNKLIEQQNHASKVATSYLALTSAQYLVNKDLLGINVLLTRMQKDGMFDFASIYLTLLLDRVVASLFRRRSSPLLLHSLVSKFCSSRSISLCVQD